MSEFRTTARLTTDGTFVVPAPKDLPQGTLAEVIVRYDAPPPSQSEKDDPVKAFYEWLDRQPPQPSTWEVEQTSVRQLRDEWN